jgi:hypothetical protein
VGSQALTINEMLVTSHLTAALISLFNLLKYTSNFTYHQIEHLQILHSDYIPFVCSQEKKQHLSTYTS